MANTSKGVLFLPSSDAYVRSFFYLLYTLIKLLHKSSERSNLASGPGLNSSPLEAKNPGVFVLFSNNLSALHLKANHEGFISGELSEI